MSSRLDNDCRDCGRLTELGDTDRLSRHQGTSEDEIPLLVSTPLHRTPFPSSWELEPVLKSDLPI